MASANPAETCWLYTQVLSVINVSGLYFFHSCACCFEQGHPLCVSRWFQSVRAGQADV